MNRQAAWLLVFSFHFLLALPFLGMHHDIPDEDAYQTFAENLIDHGGYYLDSPSFHQKAKEPNTYYAPGWPIVLAAGYALGHHPLGFWFVSGLVWCASLWFALLLGMEFDLRSAWLWGLAFWFSANPFYLYYHLHLMTESMAIGLGAVILALGIRWLRAPSWQSACLLGLAAGVGHLTRSALMLPFVAICVVTVVKVPFRKLVAPALACLAAYALIVSPWMIRMRSLGVGFGVTEVKLGQNLFLYNYSDVENPYDLRNGEHIEFPAGLDDMKPAERDATLVRYALSGIANHPLKYLHNCLRRVWYLLSPVPNFYSASRSVKLAMVCATCVFCFLPWAVIVVLLLRGTRLTSSEALVITSILLWYAFHIFVHASVRQRLPSDLWVAVLALSMLQRMKPSFPQILLRASGK